MSENSGKRNEEDSEWEDYADNLDNDEVSEMAKYAQDWYNSITRREARIRMLKNYVRSLTDEELTDEDVERILEQVDL